MKKWKLYSIKGYKFEHKIPRNPTDKKEKNKEQKQIDIRQDYKKEKRTINLRWYWEIKRCVKVGENWLSTP